MSLYNLATKLRDIERERQKQRLIEATTIDAISFIPAHLGTVKAKIQSLAKEKPEWGIEVLEDVDFNVLQIENRLRITVPKEYWDSFQEIFDGKLDSNCYLNLRALLNEDMREVIEDDMRDLRKGLKPALTEMFNEQDFKSLDKAVNVWKSWFQVSSYKTRENKGPVVSCERKGKDIQRLCGKLLREYGEDKGGLEMLLEDVDSNRPLNAYDVFKDYDFLYGTRIQSRLDNVPMIFEAMIDIAFNLSQSIYIGDKEVLDEIEEQITTVKRVGNVLYPVGGQFNPGFFRALKDIVEDAVTEESE